MQTIKITPRGYCHGVVNAINTITKLTELSTKKPITILGWVVHNKQVVDYFKAKGIKTLHDPSKTRLELLDEIDEGIVVFTAHGVSPQVYKKAEEKGLEIIDTTCRDVVKSHTVVQELIDDDYEIIYIGKHNHPESDGAKGISPYVHVVETIEEIKSLRITKSKVALTNQTTMSLYDIYQLAEEAQALYPDIYFVDEICNATRIRQEAVRNASQDIDHIYVVGDSMSNNSRHLQQVSIEEADIPSTLIQSVEDINIKELAQYKVVGVTSGASTPTQVTNEVIAFLQQFDPSDTSTHQNISSLRTETLLERKSTR
ncbi:4-hydroxy-3-methylbut-2-enyl diphosphate reductase [Candidatus Xianfuyuplasma coldseepsis]|uniref:4-hydroxy-3-methylbut-2-enyl diphosphate reductase n=1 Tax=Candidatus Xianfuyuplasma coldseepsis TaxID=2782163 RepID=A0A7L7KTQ2_9MOLU|nr:4-hydroxy-3-methylbut-2-enyl diphosphate reductase [Xianfuyuplasma coldseepsis]QMS85692.1 4-hydroxy-3-methylbut-2-enyl diphosphate reductase [Xianfuyuplasma coldseepsis]